MKAHLSSDDLVTALDGRLDGAPAAHLEACVACQAAVDRMRALVGQLRADEVPEPPPAFWNALDAGVARARIVPGPRTPWASARWWAAFGGVAAVLAGALVWWGAFDRARGELDAAPQAATRVADDPSWQVMTELVSTLSADDVRRVTASPGNGALADLSADERRAFVELLKLEMGEPQ